ncbi:MAG: endonuclease/exonuclease/phosphatase family protein [Paracoccaceae bacterium]
MSNLQIACATWNIHRAVGQDGQKDPVRVVDAIEAAIVPEGPDILALQEADEDCPPHGRIIDVDRISQSTGLVYQHTEDRLRWGPQSDGFLGTILWVSPRFTQTHADVIDLPGHCHRGVISVELTSGDMRFRVMSGHFSLSQALRMVQMRILGQYMKRRPLMQTIILGDLNEWRPWGGFAISNQMLGSKFHGPALRTFPTKRPLLPLDRILTNGMQPIKDAKVIRGQQTNVASDHCPLVAQVAIDDFAEISDLN